MKTFVKWIDQYAVWVLVGVFVLTLAMIPGARKITIARGFDHDVFPAFNEMVASVKNVRTTFGANIRQVIISVETQGERRITDPFVLDLIENISQALKTVPLIKANTIMSIGSVREFSNKGDEIATELLIQNRPNNAAEIRALEKKIAQDPFFYGKLISKDFHSAIIIATTYDNADLADIHHQVSKVIDPLQDSVPNTKLTILGEPEVNYLIFTSIEKDILIFSLISILLILATFFIMFQSWRGVVLPLCGILTGIIWTMGCVGYYGEPITLLSATLPVALVVMCSEMALHVFHHLVEHSRNGVSFEKAFTRVIKQIFFPLSMATVTAFLGGVTLLAFKIHPIQHFGVFCAIGALVAMFVSVVLIPAMFRVLYRPVQQIEDVVTGGIETAKALAHMTLQTVPVAGPVTEAIAETATESIRGAVVGGWDGFWKGFRQTSPIERGLKGIANLVYRHSVLVVLTVPVILALGISQIPKVQIGFDNVAFLPEKSPVRKAITRLDQSFGGTQKFDLMIDAKRPNGLLDASFLEKLDRFEAEALKVQDVTYSFSVVHLLKKVHQLLQPESKTLLPQSSDALSQYLFLLGMSSTGIPLSSLVTSDYQKLKLSLNLAVHDTKDAARIHEQLTEIGHRVFGDQASLTIGGDLVYSIAMTRYLVWGKIQNILALLLAIFVLIAVVYQSITNAIMITLSLPIGVILNFGLMGATGIRLDFVTAIITSFAMGLGVGFAIHFISGVQQMYRKSHKLSRAITDTIQDRGRVIVYNCISNILGFGVLLFSSFKAIHVFSILMAFNMVVILLSTLIVVPAVLTLVPPEFITQHRKLNQIEQSRFQFAMKIAFSSVAVMILSLGIYWLDAKAAQPAAAATPSAQELINKATDTIYTISEEATYVMRLVAADGKENTRKMRVWFKREPDKAKLLIKLTEPADLRGTGLLSIVEMSKSTDQWLYLPAIKKARRIKGGNQDEAFLGSDFSVSDLSVDKQDRFDYQVQGTKKCGEVECYVLVGAPKADADKSSLPYSKKIVELRKDNTMVAKTEFYNQAGQLEKVMTLMGVHLEKGKHWMADKLEMKNLLTHHSTVIEVQKRDISQEPANSLFTQSNLERN